MFLYIDKLDPIAFTSRQLRQPDGLEKQTKRYSIIKAIAPYPVSVMANAVERAPKAQQILDGAMQEFLKRGYASTSMDRVAAAANVSKATVYNHFGDKERLFETLVQQLAQEKFQQLSQMRSLEGDPQVVLREFAYHFLGRIASDRDYLAFVRLVIGESGRFPHLAQTFVRNLFKPGLALMTEYLSEQAQLQSEDPEAAARVFIGALVHYVIVEEIMQGGDLVPMSRERIVDTAIAMLFATSQT